MNEERKARFKANKKARKAAARMIAAQVEEGLRAAQGKRNAQKEKERLAAIGIKPVAGVSLGRRF